MATKLSGQTSIIELFSLYPIFFWRGEEQNREEGEMAQKKLGGGRNRGEK